MGPIDIYAPENYELAEAHVDEFIIHESELIHTACGWKQAFHGFSTLAIRNAMIRHLVREHKEGKA